MEKIIIQYWKQKNLIEGINHGEEFDFSMDKVYELVNKITEANYSIMLRPNMGEKNDIFLIYIDKGRFGQS